MINVSGPGMPLDVGRTGPVVVENLIEVYVDYGGDDLYLPLT